MKKIVYIILFLIILSIGITISDIEIFKSKPALKLFITIGMNEDEVLKITNVTFEQTTVPFFYARRDIPAKFPEIDAYAKYSVINSEPISYWAATYKAEDRGTYQLTLLFKNGKEPKYNDTLIIPIRITNFKGSQEYKNTVFYGWK